MSRSSDRFTADARPEFLKRPRPTEIKSLSVGAAKSLENGELAGGFDAFGDDRRAKTGGHRLEAGNDDFGAFVCAEPMQETGIDLQFVEFQLPQVLERGEAGPEIVESDPQSHLAKPGNAFHDGVCRALNEYVLSDFERQLKPGCRMLIQQFPKVCPATPCRKGNLGDVDRDITRKLLLFDEGVYVRKHPARHVKKELAV